METLITALSMLLAVTLSGVLARLIAVPLPLLQIALGMFLAWPVGIEITLEPELFFVFFVPPLIFREAWHMPNAEIFRLKGPILALAVGLVIATVLGIGLFVNWALPVIPLAVAFALAAALAPTDVVALTAVAGRAAMPPRLSQLLKGESLLNDATGLVCLGFAVTAQLTGAFSWSAASLAFIKVAIGGLLIGAATTGVFGMIQRRIVQWTGEHPSTQVLMTLLLPFAAYLAAEQVHVSGILAAVAAGLAMESIGLKNAGQLATRMQAGAVWNMVEFALNGSIFLLLGLQMPGIVGAIGTFADSGWNAELWSAVAMIGLITVGLFIIRLLWVWVSTEITFRWFWRVAMGSRPRFKIIVAATVGGVRGAITLAALLSLPLMQKAGVPFPARDLIIFLGSGVILGTLLIATFGFRWLLHGLEFPNEYPAIIEERDARTAMAEAALRRVEEARRALAETQSANDLAFHAEIGARVMRDYQQQIDEGELTERARARARAATLAERAFRLAGLRAQRQELYRLKTDEKIAEGGFKKLLMELDLAETALTNAKGSR